MSKRFNVTNFARGLSDDRYDNVPGQFAYSKHFDILTHPRRLVPLRSMSSDTTNTYIGNIIVGSDGLMYGVGTDAPNGNATKGKLWQRYDGASGYGSSSVWQSIATNNQVSGTDVIYDLLVDYPENGIAKHIYWASTGLLLASDPLGASLAVTQDQSLTFTTIGQGFVHPKDKILYIPYKNATSQQIATVSPNAAPFGAYSATSFSGLQFLYRAYCLSYYSDYLAIPQTSVQGIGAIGSFVGLWKRDTSISTFDEIIPWGAGSLQVLNNLDGVLVGVSTKSANNTGSFQDYDSILIKAWDGGASPTLIKELKVPYAAGGTPTATHPTASINPRVNFVYQNRLYFSVSLVPGDGLHAAKYGLWSVGKNKLTGEWTVVNERAATSDDSETSVIAAAIQGDFVSMAHTTAGTMSCTPIATQSASTFAATSKYESLVNPDFDPQDAMIEKKLDSLGVTFLPLPTSGQVVLKYRVDSAGNETDWLTVYTYTTAGGTQFSTPKPAAGFFMDGYNYEFRLESTGGATITGFGGRYSPKATIL